VAVVSFVIGGLLVAVMIGIAAYGWVTLPADARVPVHRGFGGYNTFLSKKAAMVLFPVTGAVILAILITVTGAGAKPGHPSQSVPVLIILIALVAVAATEWGAIAAARKNGAFRG
jgi:hypothetical protein